MPENALPPARHEPTDVGVPFIWIGAPLVIVIVLLVGLLAFGMFHEALPPRIMHLPLPQFPAPRLQVDPSADQTSLHMQKLRQLNSMGWIDRSQGIAHIPIADAMRKVAQQGIPGWPTPQGKRP
jgi:hypothetical protein